MENSVTEQIGGTMSISKFMEEIWETYKDHPLINHPGWWRLIIEATITDVKEETDEDVILLDNLEKSIVKVTKSWWKNCDKWEVKHFKDLLDKSIRLLGATLAMSFPTDMMEIVIGSWHSCTALADYTEEDCSTILTTKHTSMLSTIALGQMEVADANSKKRSAAEAFKELVEQIDSSGSSASPTGMTTSFISYSTNFNEVPRKFGLVEKYKDYRLVVSYE